MIKVSYPILLIVCFMLVAVCVGWGVKVYDGSVPVLDRWSNVYAEQVEGTAIYWVFRRLTIFGSASFLIPFVIVATIIVWRLHRDVLPGFMMAVGPFFCHFVNMGIKLLVQRERPQILAAADAEGYSFPSGHSMLSVVCYGLFLYFLLRRWQSAKTKIVLPIIGMTVIMTIGASRYLIRVHYLTDVVAGYVIGFLVLLFWIGIYQYIHMKLQKRFLS